MCAALFMLLALLGLRANCAGDDDDEGAGGHGYECAYYEFNGCIMDTL